MNGLKLVAAGLCGRALTLGLTALAQAPKRAPVVECPAPAALQSIESDVSQMASRIRSVSGDLHTIESSLLMISLKLGR